MSNADTLRRIFSLMDEKDFASISELLAPEFSVHPARTLRRRMWIVSRGAVSARSLAPKGASHRPGP